MSGNPLAPDPIDRMRSVIRDGFRMFIERGFSTEDAAIAALYVCFDLAEMLPQAGAGQGAIEWMRTGCDMIERSIAAGAERRPG